MNTPRVNKGESLYYPINETNETKDGINYNVQLFITDVGANKYHLKPTMPAMRVDLGGQPFILITVTLPETVPFSSGIGSKLTIPFMIQNIRGKLKVIFTGYLEGLAEFIVDGEILAGGYASSGSQSRIYLNAPDMTPEETLKRQKINRKKLEKEDRTNKEQEHKDFIEAKKEANKLSQTEIMLLQEIADNKGVILKASNDVIQRLLDGDYIGVERKLFRKRYFYKSKGALIMNYVRHRYEE